MSESTETKPFKLPGRRLSLGEITGLIVLALNVGAIVWGAATASATVNSLAEAFKDLKISVVSQGNDLNTIKIDLGVMKADVGNLKAQGSNSRAGGGR